MSDAFIPTLTHATERDIDLLVVEELFASPQFVDWMFLQAGLPATTGPAMVLHSKRRTRSRREIDIFVEAKTANGALVGLLVENKLDTSEQPDQAESYREELGVMAARFAHRAMVLICPSAYASQNKAFSGKFDAVVTYEQLAAYFGERAGGAGVEPARMRFRADLLQQAVTKARRGYEPVPNATIGGFNARYVELLGRVAPGIFPGPSMLKEANPDESVSMIFDAGRSLAFLPDHLRPSRFAHELGRGSARRSNYVAVVFSRWGQALQTLGDEFEHDAAAIGASFLAKPTKGRPNPGLVMACPTDPIDNQGDFEQQRSAIERSIRRAVELQSWLRDNQQTLERWKTKVDEVLSRS